MLAGHARENRGPTLCRRGRECSTLSCRARVREDLDARVEKVINLQRLQVALSLDVFNVLNDGTVLQRQGQTNASSDDRITEIQSPRVVRAGARVTF